MPLPNRLLTHAPRRVCALLLLALVQACGDSTPPESTVSVLSTCGAAVTAEQALQAINAVRATARQCGSQSFAAAPPLQWSTQLASAAEAHSADMANRNYVSHTSLDGNTPAARATAVGYTGQMGENIGAGYATMDAAMSAWIQSPGHCANLMNPNYRDYGIACASAAASTYGTYWTQEFGQRSP
jgi:uncharacterized protein YkwD